jgi:hypothetical protein
MKWKIHMVRLLLICLHAPELETRMVGCENLAASNGEMLLFQVSGLREIGYS